MKTFVLFLVLIPFIALAQSPIVTAFSSLRIPASSRGLSMGDCGIASASDNQQLSYNQAKTAFMQNYHQVSLGYTPWLSAISTDTRFMNVSYLANTSNTSAFGIALNYLRLGNVQTRDNNGALIAQSNVSEYNLCGSLALQLNESASLGVGLRLLVSQQGQALDPGSYTTMAQHIFSACADLSYYQVFELGGDGKLEMGAVIANLGPKVGSGTGADKVFLPTNLGIGLSYTKEATGNQFVFAIDANKLLVPTLPERDAAGNITAGKDPNRSVLNALFSSFADAPGGFREELRELRINAGCELAFDKTFFLRGGVSLENDQKGNRKFFGLGAGYRGVLSDQSWGLDFHYLVPLSTKTVVSPFQNSWGFTLRLSMGSFE